MSMYSRGGKQNGIIAFLLSPSLFLSVHFLQDTLNMCLPLRRQAHSRERLVHVQGTRHKRSCQPERRAEAKEETVGVFIRRMIL